MSAVEVHETVKRYGAVAALDRVTLRVAEGEFFGLLGPSGSGKTTLLRAIAGFVMPESGEIRIDGQRIETVPVHKRGIGMVFQNYALFPHLSVFDNIAFGLQVRGIAKAEITERVAEALRLVRLSGLEERRPRQLSGGQQQRVALARALVTRPKVLLLDEPLGALDKRLRQEMQVELKQIQRTVGITTLFVTHDQEEALTLCDRIAILSEGRLMQIGPPAQVYEHPQSRFAAEFLGEANLFCGSVERGAAAGGKVRTTAGVAVESALPPPDGEAILAVRPEKIQLVDPAKDAPARANRVEGRILRSIYSGSSIAYRIEIPGQELTVFEQNRAAAPRDAGAAVTLFWAPEHSIWVTP
ncbi:MAG TPA: ABC transporter ATP-binding protein [Alphaproteobacteria bacterium]|nr:ABC transporter ATP-binding protein [Alphaproteobacteria bacterium]